MLHSVLSARFIFNLRETQRGDQTLQSISGIAFVSMSDTKRRAVDEDVVEGARHNTRRVDEETFMSMQLTELL